MKFKAIKELDFFIDRNESTKLRIPQGTIIESKGTVTNQLDRHFEVTSTEIVTISIPILTTARNSCLEKEQCVYIEKPINARVFKEFFVRAYDTEEEIEVKKNAKMNFLEKNNG